MGGKARSKRLKVCLLSPHPLFLAEFERVLAGDAFHLVFHQLESTVPAELRRASLPQAPLHVVDGQSAAPAVQALIENILEQSPRSRVLVLATKYSDASSFAVLRAGAKGLLTYANAEKQWHKALEQVAEGGYWVPRAVLSRFVEAILGDTRTLVPKGKLSGTLSRREHEVMDSLLENLSNKEIASRLNISERTVKFHVSNLLAKYGVRRRADLIVLRFQAGMQLAAGS